MIRGRTMLPLAGMALLFGAFTAQVKGQGKSTLIPDSSWSCGMAEGIPAPERGTLVFEARMNLRQVYDLGRTQYGTRQVAIIEDGTFTGPKVSGSVMPGALDLELTLSNGTVETEEILVLQTSDGDYIYSRDAGVGPDVGDVRVVMDFEAPSESAVAWLNEGKYVAQRNLDVASKTLTLRVYDVTGLDLTAPGEVTRIQKPSGAPAQPWDYRKSDSTEKQGEVLITESVTLAPSQRVGESKNGIRNIIPITGGQIQGKINGKVLFGGADYQHLSPPATIDARYLWQADDGEVILIRNVGTFGALVPTFEARTDGPYAFLNDGLYLSSNPGMADGGVSITIYESTKQKE